MKKIVLATVLAAGMATSASAQSAPPALGSLSGVGGAVVAALTVVIVAAASSSSSGTN